MHGSTGRSGYPSDSSRCRWSRGGSSLSGRYPSTTTHPPPSSLRVRGGGAAPLGPVTRRARGPQVPLSSGPRGSESFSRRGGLELLRCHRRLGPSSPPPAAGRSPTASVGAWGQRPSPHTADRSPSALAGAWGRSPSPPASGRNPFAINRAPGARAPRRRGGPESARAYRHSATTPPQLAGRARQLMMASRGLGTATPDLGHSRRR